MTITGIVMECNPFHDGHQYILDEARCVTNADYVVVILSGDYVQRGSPAIISKERRAYSVLAAGADLVLELSLPYATGAANHFAYGAMQILTSLGVVTDLAFGSLSADIGAITRAAKLLDNEPPEYQASLRSALAEGLSYPAARDRAAAGALGISLPTNGNDVLGIEYVRALNVFDSERRIRVHAIPRIDTDSATMHRTRLLSEQQNKAVQAGVHTLLTQTNKADADPAQAQDANPIDNAPYYMSADDLSSHLYYRLQTITGLAGTADPVTALMSYQDVDHDLACRIIRLLPQYTNWSEFTDLLKTRNVTYTRVSRALLHILLDIRCTDVDALRANGSIGYARVLGFRKSAGPLLRTIQESSHVPLITAPRAGLTNAAIPQLYREQLRRDLAASELYDYIALQGRSADVRICELTKQPVML